MYNRDAWLVEKDLSEQRITHRLAMYLQMIFADYDVDCEYNGNAERENGRKKIYMVKQHLKGQNLLTEFEELDLNKELVERAAFPDIIIHRRGVNEHNLCIIEVKKNTSSISPNYDKFKLEAYTSNILGNDLNYKLGLFLMLMMKGKAGQFELHSFKNGQKL